MPKAETGAILFNDFSVRAILAGRKTQTRRTSISLKALNADPLSNRMFKTIRIEKRQNHWMAFRPDGSLLGAAREPYSPGRIYKVKEVHAFDRMVQDRVWFRADDSVYELNGEGMKKVLRREAGSGPKKWLSTIFMPMRYARLAIQLTSVRLERLHDITPADALAEGIDPEVSDYEAKLRGKEKYPRVFWAERYSERGLHRAVACYAALWDSIQTPSPNNGPKTQALLAKMHRPTWEANPFVWRIEFTVLKAL
jgi:hypothetical protein